MGKGNIGSLIRTATKNISSGQTLTDNEQAIVSNLSIPMKEAQRNWHPIFVRENWVASVSTSWQFSHFRSSKAGRPGSGLLHPG